MTRAQAARVRAYVGLGSNLDEPRTQVTQALDALGRIRCTGLVAHSRLYLSAPMGVQDQPQFVNAVAAVDTALSARDLLQELFAIERRHGRLRGGQHWGPRTLDLDLLLYGEELISIPGLTVPHPGLSVRNFVLYPLHEIAPDLVIPGGGALADAVRRCPATGLRSLE